MKRCPSSANDVGELLVFDSHQMVQFLMHALDVHLLAFVNERREKSRSKVLQHEGMIISS